MKTRQLASDRITRVHTPDFMQNVSLGFRNRELVADKVAPRITVNAQSNKYRVFGKNQNLTAEARWFPGTIPNAIETRWSEGTYFAELRKLRTLLLDTEVRNADGDLDLRTKYTENVTNAIALAREKRVADLFTTAGNYSAGQKITKTGGSEWDQASVVSTAQPLIDIMALISKVVINAMVPASALTVIIPEPVYLTALWQNAGILARVQYSNTGVVTTDLLKQLLGVKEVIQVASMSAGPGPEVADSDVVSGFTMTYLWGDTVWVGLINEGQNDNVPSFARSFNWTAETAGQERQVRQYRAEDEGREADWIECKEAIGEQIVYADAGGIIINTLSTI
jgi:hypothetical protein